MKRAPNHLTRLAARASLALALLAGATLNAQIVTLVDCPDGTVGDFYDRGFYVPVYPGSSITSVRLYMGTGTGGGTHPYQIAITARLNTYDGPVLASGFASVTLNATTETAVNVQMISGGGGNPPVPPGSTIAFIVGVNKQPGAPDPLYAVPGLTGGCPDVIQTNGTNPPLSSFRRNGVKILITGNKYLKVSPGQSIQLAIDNADPGDTVTVMPGTYTENLTLRSGIDVEGAGADDTILNGTGTGSVVTANNVNNLEFTGFTVQGSGNAGLDAGFRITGSDIVVRGNTITDNTVGILTSGSSSFICNNVITGNGIPGGAVDHAVYCSGSDLFAGNFIVDNEGGPIAISSNGSQFINNTIANNNWWGFQADGLTTNTTLKNNILYQNTAGGIFSDDDAVIQSTYNCISGPGSAYAQVRGGTITSRLGDLLADPLFDPAQPGEYLLSLSSPCIDAGDPAAFYNDLDGSRNDIGATGGLCGSSTPVGSIVSGFVWTSVGSYANITGIAQTGTKRGLTTDRDRPFGGHPWLFGAFGNTEGSVVRYAVKVAKWSGATPPAAGAFVYRDDALNKTRFDISGGTLVAENVAIGPTIQAGRPTYQLTRNSGNTFWAHENLRLKLDTNDLESGTYSVRIEGLNLLGAVVSLSVNQDIIIRVNNTRPVASIDAVSFGGGAPFDECSIIDLPSATSTLNFVYTASHADGFLDNYALVAEVGRNRSGGTIVSDTYANHVDPNAVWGGVTMAPVAATPVSPEQPLPNLQLWETCAYQFRVTAWARTTDGFGRIYAATFFDNYALDLEPGGPCSPDLDGDGDVDAEDLAIMAAAYGTAP